MRDDAVGVTGRMTIRKEVWRLERGKRFDYREILILISLDV